jgi:hypothetical protein
MAAASMIPACGISHTPLAATLEERWDGLQPQRHVQIEGKPPSHLLLRWHLLKISTKMLSEYSRSTEAIRILGRSKPLQHPVISHPPFLTTFGLTSNTMPLFVSPIVQPASAIESEFPGGRPPRGSGYPGRGPESRSSRPSMSTSNEVHDRTVTDRPSFSPEYVSQPQTGLKRVGLPLEEGPAPPGQQLTKRNEGAQSLERKEKEVIPDSGENASWWRSCCC